MDKKTTRRTFLAAAGGAALLRPAVASAATGDPMILGAENRAASTTTLRAQREQALICYANTDDGAIVGINDFMDGYGMRARGGHLGLLAGGGSFGLSASSEHGVGVSAESWDGTGIHTLVGPDGVALHVEGRVRLSRSGKATVAKGQRSTTVRGVELGPNSMVLATLQADLRNIVLRSAVPHPQNQSFTLHLSGLAPAAAPIAWFVLD